MAHYFRNWSLIAAASLCWLAQSNHCYAATPNTPREEPEQILETVMGQIREQKITLALKNLDDLIARYPDFQVAQLMRADLLYAQGSILNKMGQVANDETVQNVKSEMDARFNATKAPPEGTLPANVLGIPSWLSHLITINLKESRAYLFNIEQGRLKFVTSFYMTQGKLGAGKEKEGDKRTPIGAYLLDEHIHPSRISSFYGIGAVPLQYPNTWDKRNGRSGHGIWLHGTPIGQYSRPPKASDGCVVFTNDDLQNILTLDWRKTLVIIDKDLSWISPSAYQEQQKTMLTVIDNWRSTWEKQDLAGYLNFYAPDFMSGARENLKDWSARKTQIFSYQRPHSIELSDLLLIAYPDDPSVMVTTFNQKYTKEGKTSVERKRLWWKKNQNHWQIFNEEVITTPQL